MSQPWPTVPHSEIAKPVTRPVDVVPGQSYRTIGVKWWGEGAYERQTIDGSQTAAKVLSLVKQDDLIINKIWVRHGSTAIATEAVDGCAASNEFPTFELDIQQVTPRWLHWFTKTGDFWAKCDHLSMGTSGKNRIKPEKFLTIEIPLPLLAEQRRIAAKIEALAAKIEEAKRLRQDAGAGADAFTHSCLNQVYSAQEQAYGVSTLGELCGNITDGAHLTPTFVEQGVKFIFVGSVSSGYLHFNGCKYVTPENYQSVAQTRKPERGDVLYSAVGATLGIPAIVDRDEDFCFQRHIAIIKPERSKLDSRFLWCMLRSGVLFHRAWSAITGTAQPTVPLKAIRALPLPAPPISEQRRLVAELDALQVRVDEARKQQTVTGAELNALLPAILDRAFKGAL
jgi:type I restriction enzyme S subunit